MGFHLGVTAPGFEGKLDCYFFIDKAFFWFVETASIFGKNSVIEKVGEIYDIDLLPFTKFLYTNSEELTETEIDGALQNIDDIITLTKLFIKKINENEFAITTAQYQSYEKLELPDKEILKIWTKEFGRDIANAYRKNIEETIRYQKENPNCWNSYFTSKEIIEHLTAILKSLTCFKEKGVKKFFFIAG